MKLHSGLFAIVAASIFWIAESKPNPRQKPSLEVEADAKAKSIRVANADAKPTIEVKDGAGTKRIRVADAKTIREAKDGSKHSRGNKDEIKPIRVTEDDTTEELSPSNHDDVSRIVGGTQSGLGEFPYFVQLVYNDINFFFLWWLPYH